MITYKRMLSQWQIDSLYVLPTEEKTCLGIKIFPLQLKKEGVRHFLQRCTETTGAKISVRRKIRETD